MAAHKTLPVGLTPSGDEALLDLTKANRHGLIAGATGTGKTVTLQTLAEGFASNGVNVFLADVKGDLAGLSRAGLMSEKLEARVKKLKLKDYRNAAFPVVFWDFYGKKGLHLRTTVSEMGPLLLGRLIDLNDTQSGVLEILFKLADDQGLLLLDVKDLQALVTWAIEHAPELKSDYGNLSTTTLGTIQRKLIILGDAGGESFFGEPALQLEHLLQTDLSGNGIIHDLDASSLMNDPRVYTSFMLWLLSELFETLPEVGDLEKPKLVFFFDEAHLIFKDAPKVLLEKIEKVVRLVRSKGVGVYFITQNPLDVPESVLGQLGNRVQHALRAFTPADQKAVRAAADTFRPNPKIKTEEAITELGVGEALVSFLDAEGRPSPVERVTILPPSSRMGPVTDEERVETLSRSPWKSFYEKAVDRESAFEVLKGRAVATAKEGPATASGSAPAQSGGGFMDKLGGLLGGGPKRSRESVGEAMVKSVARAAGSQIGRSIIRGVLGSILKK
jgi:hypothetical protein